MQIRINTDGKRCCLLEARLAGLQPISLGYQAAILEPSDDGAVDKLKRSIDSTIGRLGKRRWTTLPAEGAGSSQLSFHARAEGQQPVRPGT